MMKLLPNFLIKIFRKKSEPEKYETFLLNGNLMSKEQKEMLRISKKILNDNNVPLNKIKFVLEPSFMYDIDNDRINPTYRQLVSKNKKTPIIEINKPENSMMVFLGEYRTSDNYDMLKKLVKQTKKGITILAGTDYDDVIYLANLDDAIAHYNEVINQFEYES